MIQGDRNLIFQAVSNLLDNAVKNSPNNGSVAIVATKEKNNVRLKISDSGLGIPEKEYKRVLERFARLDQSRSLPGSGLGLSVVSAVIKLHRGTLRFHDNNPGLRVEVSLPLSDIS
jgi:signal transduction histidine kinase